MAGGSTSPVGNGLHRTWLNRPVRLLGPARLGAARSDLEEVLSPRKSPWIPSKLPQPKPLEQ